MIKPVSEQNIRDAFVLLEHWIVRYKTIYGLKYMTNNVHQHIHLPAQVARFGPLFKNSVFHFEGSLF